MTRPGASSKCKVIVCAMISLIRRITSYSKFALNLGWSSMKATQAGIGSFATRVLVTHTMLYGVGVLSRQAA